MKEELLEQVTNLKLALEASNAPESEIEDQIVCTIELCAKYLGAKYVVKKV